MGYPAESHRVNAPHGRISFETNNVTGGTIDRETRGTRYGREQRTGIGGGSDSDAKQ
jgi:hypothetical protein